MRGRDSSIMAPSLKVVLFMFALSSRFTCYSGVVKIPDEKDGTDDVLYDSAEVMKINRLPEMLKKMTEGGTYGNVNSSEIWLDDFNKGLEKLKNYLAQTTWDYETHLTGTSMAKSPGNQGIGQNWIKLISILSLSAGWGYVHGYVPVFSGTFPARRFPSRTRHPEDMTVLKHVYDKTNEIYIPPPQCMFILGVSKAADKWIREFNNDLEKRQYISTVADWNYATNITSENSAKTEEAEKKFLAWMDGQQPVARRFYYHFKRCDRGLAPCTSKVADLTRAFKVIVTTLSSPSPRDPVKRDEMLHIATLLQSTYSTAKLYRDGQTYQIEPGLTNILAKSRDYDELLWAWSGWRNETGRRMRSMFDRFVLLQNEGARSIGLADAGVHWRQSNFEMDEELEQMVDALYRQLRPLYRQLHAYVRRKLIEAYPNRGLEPTGPIPAHLLGNMWAQEWNNIYDLVVPYPEVESTDVTPQMLAQNYTTKRMFETAEKFFTSIGLEKMTPTFWKKSMLTKPADRQVVCHAAAYDFFVGDDYRIKMCSELNQEQLQTIHHEMGHIEYFMLYRHQPTIFRSGANAAFHEAVGDTIALSVMSPKHLRAIGLLPHSAPQDDDTAQKRDLNFLMKIALTKVAFLPFGYLIDKYRWNVFRGNINNTNYNSKWWEYRLQYQGISPPIERTEDDFDPGAKYHVAANVPYMRYFLSFIGQFQFHMALCKAAGELEDKADKLHNCDIYGSTLAGLKLRAALGRGNSRPWKETMRVLTGRPDFNAAAIKAYFKPLTDWLKTENEKAGDKEGWQGEAVLNDDSAGETLEGDENELLDALLEAIAHGH